MFLELENKNLKKENDELKKMVEDYQNSGVLNKSDNVREEQPTNKSFQKDIKNVVDISIKMKYLLEQCRSYPLPMVLGKEIDKVLKEIDRI